MRKLFAILVYTFVILLIGRNLLILPRFNLLSSEKSATSDLKQQTASLLKQQQGSYGLYYLDLTSGESFGINDEMTFTAASVNKVPIVAVLYYLEHAGKINLDEEITLQKADIQDYGSGSLRYKGAGQVYSLRSLAKLALQQSDNTAAFVLNKKIGTDVIQKTIENWGLTQTDMVDNKTSARDMGILFKKIYDRELTTDALTKELLGFMQNTDIEDRLPSLLPSDAIIYHKTGDAVGSLHDVGIIKRGNLTFFIGILTSDVGNVSDKTKVVEGEIAKNILTYYANRQ